MSTTAKTEARKKGKKDEDGKKEEEGADKMDVVKEEPGKDDTENKDANKSMDEDKQGGEKKKEPNTTTLSNPARYVFLSSMHALRMASLQGASRSTKVHHDACGLQVAGLDGDAVKSLTSLTDTSRCQRSSGVL